MLSEARGAGIIRRCLPFPPANLLGETLRRRGETFEAIRMLETLGAEIARRLFREPRLTTLEMTLRKPELFTDLATIGLQLRFFRDRE